MAKIFSSDDFPEDIASAANLYISNGATLQGLIPSDWDITPYMVVGSPCNGTYMRALNDGGWPAGKTTFQSGGKKLGFFLNGYSTPNYPDVNHWSVNMNFKQAQLNLAWAQGRQLHAAINLTHTGITMDQARATGYTYIGMNLTDTTTGKVIQLVIHLSDTRGVMPGTDVQYSQETGGLQHPFISTPLVSGSPYLTSYGSPWTGGTATRTVAHHFTISAAQLQALLQLARNKYPAQFGDLSTDSSKFAIWGLGYLMEMASFSKTTYIQGHMGLVVNTCNFVSQ